MFIVQPIAVLKDNYIWLIRHPQKKQAMIVDPGVAMPVQQVLSEAALELTAILLTHHHHDHSGGVAELTAQYNVPVYGPATENIATVTHPLHENDEIYLPSVELSLRTLLVPGHTRGHIAYYGNGLLFCGDTLFNAGCGRLFEGTATQLFASLEKLAALPNKTRVYCGHEYTLTNLTFAQTVEPDNFAIQQTINTVQQLRAQHQPSLPSTIEREKQINPFLRCHINTVHKSVENHWQITLSTPVSVFQYLRQWKDNFKS